MIYPVNPPDTDNPHSEHRQTGMDASFQRKGSRSFCRTSSVDQNISQTSERYSIDPVMGGTEDVKLLSKNAHNLGYELAEGRQVMDQSGQKR